MVNLQDDLSKYYVIFDDNTTNVILNYIRQNIYIKYPYKSLSNSSLLSNFRFERIELDREYLTTGNGNKLYPYKWNIIFNLYYKNDFIAGLNNFEVMIYDSKRNKEYMKIRISQNRNFK